MNHKFFDVDKDKQDRIINAGLEVFALNGYRHASTDEIVRKASISKGLLFHYFESKLGMYTFLYDYSTKFMLLEFSRRVGAAETDLFALVRSMEAARIHVLRLYPYMRRFVDCAEEEECAEAAEAVGEARAAYQERIRSILAQADYRAFGPRVDGRMAAKCVELTLKGLTEEHSRRADYTTEGLYQDICAYLDLLERVFRGAGCPAPSGKDEENGQ